MNFLLTCAGRRNYLVKFFQETLGGQGQVFAADASADAPALQQADRWFILPPVGNPAYLDTLLTICEQHRILLLIPLNDLELPLLARHCTRFLEVGTIPVISSPQVIDTCFDKWRTFEFLKASGLEAINTYLSLADGREALARGDITFPLVVKPRWGTASIGIGYADDDEELELHYRRTKRLLPLTFLWEISAADAERSVLIQKQLSGQEYGLDIVNDLDGRHVCTFVKRKLAMRAGETDRAITVKNHRLEEMGAVIGRKLGHVGVLDCDVMVTEEGCFVIDMNPRFGGGYPFSHIAGANVPAALVAWANREEPDARWFRVEPDILASKYDEIAIVNNKPFSREHAADRFDPVKQDPVALGT